MVKKIWITGASSGIGKALAIKFANKGWQVAASARRTDLLEELNKKESRRLDWGSKILSLMGIRNIVTNKRIPNL